MPKSLYYFGLLALTVQCFAAQPPVADRSAELQIAGQKIMKVREQAEALAVQGKIDEGNRLILSVFPADHMTPIEQLTLGNVLFRQNPKASYTLHQSAANGLPNYENTLLEWALEQHRAKEYAGAAKTYAAFSKLNPDYAPVFGLAAECAIRCGDLKQATKLWDQSLNARRGTLEEFETLVCEVNGPSFNDQLRATLLEKTKAGDVHAATEVLLLDAAFTTDWWNTEPNLPRLKNDLALTQKYITSADASFRAAICIADYHIRAEENGKVLMADKLKQAGIILGENALLPKNGKALSQLFQTLMSEKFFTVAEARNKFAEPFLKLARETKDADLYNVVAYLYLETDRLPQIDLEAWENTGDARFAASLLAGKIRDGKLTLDDPLLTRALREFPENCFIAGFALQLATEQQKPLTPYLVQAIKADFTKFSSDRPGVDLPRPSAYVLMKYFAALKNLKTPPQK